jgi:NAD(P)-dependent dehydrogenase (short-subunit alcohol dehydrogenase family)
MVERGGPLDGKVCLVTGGTGGIGFVVACRLADGGATVLVCGRDRVRGEAAVAHLRAGDTARQVSFVAADLSDQSEVRALARSVLEAHPRLDVLVNNAGGMFGRRVESAQGLEMTFALNHLGYFLLTLLLLPALTAAAPARIVNVASNAHRGVRLDFDDLQSRRGYHGWRAYQRSKLANILFTHELARRLDWQSVSVNAAHPGFVRTEIGVSHGFLPPPIWRLAKLFAISVEEGADTPFWLASAAEVAGSHGRYFFKRKPEVTSAAAHDRQAAARLWRESVRLTGLDDASLPEPIRVDAGP